ncbi:MAG: hypothetical protein HFI33_13850 [Lachnospiraceae bacterium]|nr:hypothetical protein [Lachnospiraceae bacterium]
MEENFTMAYKKGLQKVEYMWKHLEGFPHITRNGEWLVNQNGHWTGGFWIGLLWLDYLEYGDTGVREAAREWTRKLRCRMADNTTHDQGFIFGPSSVMGNRIFPSADFVPLIHAGARNMMDLYVKEVGLIQAWKEEGYQGISIVDTIMNLPILWISDELKGETEQKEVCQRVARRILECALRPDGSSYHVVKWDEDFRVYGDTHQGYSAESCWTRGQAWALYGFANLYRYTAQEEYLDTAQKLAKYFYEHLNKNRLPAWDVTFQDCEEMPVDASAASIAASGMLLIADLLEQKGESGKAESLIEQGKKILAAETKLCLYKEMERYGIIRQVTVDYPRGSGIGESAMYGDYYFMEALFRLKYAGNRDMLRLLY